MPMFMIPLFKCIFYIDVCLLDVLYFNSSHKHILFSICRWPGCITATSVETHTDPKGRGRHTWMHTKGYLDLSVPTAKRDSITRTLCKVTSCHILEQRSSSVAYVGRNTGIRLIMPCTWNGNTTIAKIHECCTVMDISWWKHRVAWLYLRN